ncbi:MAG TPA: DUF4832 domain-containing protein [Nitrospira sp.]|nr:DUF4832 domain-containing protein [Nitrospira sp.]
MLSHRSIRATIWLSCLFLGASLLQPAHNPWAEESSPAPAVGVPGLLLSVTPPEIDDVLVNPGMGFADFHFGFDHPPGAEEYPKATVAYFRWSWADLEPQEGAYNFDLVDRVISEAKSKGETLAFRIMTEYRKGSPQWLLGKGVASVPVQGGIFPDYNDPLFLESHEKLLRAFGSRYGGSPDIDHIDIGSIGCWGEWNTACCQGVEAECRRLFPTVENQKKITDWYFTYFPNRPLVMLHGGQLNYAAAKGAGWRGDCFGDYGYFGPDWNHMVHAYPPALEDPVVAEAWRRGPVQLEVCGVMQDWYDKGFDIDRILSKGLEWHVSVLNAKSSPVPAPWRPKVDQFLKRMGYRLVLRELRHISSAAPGGALVVGSRWENVGVAPMYHPRPLAYRLRSGDGRVLREWRSKEDLRRWVPGSPVEVEDRVLLPDDVPAGTYDLDVAILDEEGRFAAVALAISGKLDDGWYRVSRLHIGE